MSFCLRFAENMLNMSIGSFQTRRPLFTESSHFISLFKHFLPLNDLFTFIKNKFNLSSPQDQVSNFIVNNAYSGRTESLRSNLEKSRNFMTKKININSIAPSLKAFLT